MSTEQRESLDNERSPERLEAFSDGVMAVAITLLVLNIQVPEVKPPYTTALQAMLAQWPTYLGYIHQFHRSRAFLGKSSLHVQIY